MKRNDEGDVAINIGGYTVDVEPSAQGSAAAFCCLRGPAYLWSFLTSMFSCCGCFLWTALQSALCGGYCFHACKPHAKTMSEEQVTRLFTETYPFTELVTEAGGGAEPSWVVDTRAVAQVQQTSGEPLVGIRAVWRGSLLIEMTASGTNAGGLIRRSDSIRWNAALVHLVSSASYLIKFSYHPRLHFVQSVIIPAIQRWFPQPESTIRQLVDVHTEFAQQVSYNVLFTKDSVLQGPESCCCWNVQPATIDEIVKLFPVMRGAEPYKMGVPARLRDPYLSVYQEIVRFVTELVRFEKANGRWQDPKPMMDWLKPYLGDSIGDDATLFLADFIWKVSIDHGLHHENFSSGIDVRSAPMDIAASPFYTQTENQVNGSVRLGVCSLVKQHVYSEMFDKWTNDRVFHDSRTILVRYPFERSSVELSRLASQFRLNLQRLIPEPMHGRLSKSIEF